MPWQNHHILDVSNQCAAEQGSLGCIDAEPWFHAEPWWRCPSLSVTVHLRAMLVSAPHLYCHHGDHFHPSLPFTHRLQNPLGPKEGILIPQLTWIWSRGISAMYFSASSEGKTCRSFISPTSSQVGLNCLEWFFFSLKLASFPRTHSSSLLMAAAVKPLCSQLFI